jgi:hypothetical protein
MHKSIETQRKDISQIRRAANFFYYFTLVGIVFSCALVMLFVIAGGTLFTALINSLTHVH